MRLLLLANPGERLDRFQAALAGLGHSPADVLHWESLLGDPRALESRRFDLLRIESPGEHPLVERLLIARGADEHDERFQVPRISARASLALPDDPGRITHPRQRFLGFRAALCEIEALRVRCMNSPADIWAMGDKPTCHERLVMAAVPRPRMLGTPGCFDELQDLMRAHARPRVFVKLANGSSASGIAAYHGQRDRHLVITTVEHGLYNSTRMRRITVPDEVRAFFDALCAEGVLVEEWIPKAGLAGKVFDLRVVVIAGRARQVAVRTSHSPITNLHLGGGNRRGDPAEARARLGATAWENAMQVASAALAAFPRSLYGGVDVLVTAQGRAMVAEVNAFGDLLRRERHEGRDAYEAELDALLEPAAA